VLSFGERVNGRTDGIQDMGLDRPQDGRECPLIDWTVAHVGREGTLGVACPDCSALSGEGREVSFTLLRSPAFAWHDPAVLELDRPHRYTDQGEHRFRFSIRLGAGSGFTAGSAPGGRCAADALAFHRPPVCFDWTKGMQP